MITPDYRFFNGRTMNKYECETYNNLVAEIIWKDLLGKDTESLKDQAHRMINNLILFREVEK